MRWSEITATPTDRRLREFAATGAVVCTALAAWSVFVRADILTGGALAAFAAAFGLLGILCPRWLAPIFLAALVVTFPLAWVVSLLVLALIFYGLITPLYSRDNWPALDQGLTQALDGDGTTLLILADLYGSREDGAYTDNSLEAISVINCLDDPWSISADEVPDHFADFEKASPTFGKVFAWGLTACHGDPFTSTDEPDLEIDGSGAAPIVVLGTTRDPATPYQEAVAMAEQLESGVLVSRDGDGHTAYNKGNRCVDDAVHSYLIDGVVPKDGLSC